jgi:UDP-N-acetylmuramoyl-tripeptide--D-alanyl-D-alanine ligase
LDRAALRADKINKIRRSRAKSNLKSQTKNQKFMNIATAIDYMGADAEGVRAALLSVGIGGFAIDSRDLQAGQLFFALSEPDYRANGFNGHEFTDAHQFIPAALEKGAVAVVAKASRVAGDATLAPFRDRLLLVDDCIAALQRLAAGVYRGWQRPVVGVTGSAGKTTTKELAARIIATSGRRVLRNEKNYNNGLGHPLTVLRMVTPPHRPEDFDLAVLEMGISTQMSELQRLCRITPPDIGVELLVAPVHLEHFGSVERIAQFKAELVENMKPGATAVLNADDPLVAAMRSRHAGPNVTFGLEQKADVTATDIDATRFGVNRFRLVTPNGEAQAEMPLPGRHNLMNALAASAVAHCLGMSPCAIAEALRTVAPPPMRGEILRFAAGFTLIDDSYNCNPRSLVSMARTLAEGAGQGQRRFIVAGEMLELGPKAAAMHRETGREIARLGINKLWGVRGLASELLAGAGEAGLNDTRFFAGSDEAAAALPDELRAGDLVLVKGSRGVQTDRIVKAVKGKFALATD